MNRLLLLLLLPLAVLAGESTDEVSMDDPSWLIGSDVAVPYQQIRIVDFMSPRDNRNSANREQIANFSRWRDGRWHRINLVEHGAPYDTKFVCLNGRMQISKGGDFVDKAVQIGVWFRTPGDPSEAYSGPEGLAMTWKARATAGTRGVRVNSFHCLQVVDGEIEFAWEARGWRPSDKDRPVGAIIILLVLWAR